MWIRWFAFPVLSPFCRDGGAHFDLWPDFGFHREISSWQIRTIIFGEGASAQAAESQAILDVESGSAAVRKQNGGSERLQAQPAETAVRNEKETRPGLLTQLTDNDFLRSIGVAPYEPEFFEDEIRSRSRDRVIQVFAALQLIAMAAALVWTAV